jgi:hypothetical protein
LEYLRWLRRQQSETAQTIASSQRALEESLELLNRLDASAGAARIVTPRRRS